MRRKALILFTLFILSICSKTNAQNLRLRKSVTSTSVRVGDPFEYRIAAACQSTTRDCESTVITDVLPSTLEFLNFSDPLPDGIGSATFDPATNTATITFDATSCSSCTPDGINTDNDDFAQGSTIELSLQVRFPNGTFTGATAENEACATSNNAGNPCDRAQRVTATNGRDPQTGCDQMFANVGVQDPVSAGNQMWIRNRVGNLGTSTINNFTVTSEIPTYIDFDFVQVPNWPHINQNASIEYQREDQPGTWYNWQTFNVSTDGDSRYYKSDLGLPSGVDVSRLRLNLGTLSGNGDWNPYLNPAGSWQSSFRVYGYVEDGIPGGTTITACSNYSSTINGSNCNEDLCSSNNVSAPAPVLTGEKDVLNLDDERQSIFSPGDRYKVSLTFASDEVNNTDILGGVMVDVLPPGMTYVPGSFYFRWGEDDIQNQNPVIQTQNLVDGRQLVRFVWDASLGNEFTLDATGWWHGFSIAFEVQVGNGVNNGFYTNEYYYTATGSNHGCEYPIQNDTNNYTGGYAYDADVCFHSKSIEILRPPSSAGLESYKEVKGSKNANYNRYPDYGTTVPGGVNDYRLTLTNPNSTPVNDITIIDIFPYVGDTELLNNSVPRYTEWRPNLLGPISAPNGTTVSYTTVNNPCRNELAGSNPTPFPSGCSNPNWSTTPPADITDVTGIKLDINQTLNQGDTYELEWEMRAPVNAPTSGEIAWNSFAYIASNANTGAELLPAEPIKVGIETFPGSVPFHGDFVWNDLDGNGLQDPGEPGIDGVTVTLYQDNGNGQPDVNSDTPYMTTVTANGGLYLFSDFPLGDYFVVFTNLPSGFNPTHSNAGDDALDSDGLITPVMRFTSTTDDRTCDLGLFEGELPPLVELSCELIDIDDTGCQNGNATATINAVGGQGPYRYSIGSGNQSTGVFNNLSGGNYSVTVTDSRNETTVCSFFIDCVDICDTDNYTELITSCFNFGGYQGAYASSDALLGFRENLTFSPSSNSMGQYTHYATHGQIGSVYGVAISRTRRMAYTAAYMKRHAGFGPGGTGAIYAVDLDQNNAPVLLADLNAIYGAGTAGVNTHDFDESDICPGGGNFNCWFNDVDTWNAVGRSSLGDLDISDDQRYLYVMNLEDRHVYQIDINNPNATQTRYPFPLDQLTDPNVTLKPLNPQIDIRPFALKYRGNKLYVGAVNTEESRTACCWEGGSVVYVYSLDLNTGDWTLELEADIQKNGPSGAWYFSKWYPDFQDDYRDGNKMILSDIEFDGPDMILGIRDLTGDLFGHLAGKPIPGNTETVWYDNKVGDLVRFHYDLSTGEYTRESNGTSGPTTTGGAYSGYGWPADATPRGSYYYGDFQSVSHPQTSLGGLWVNPNEDRTYSTVFNPINVFSIGAKAFSNTYGSTTESYVILAGTDDIANFGKTNGLGDIEGFTDCEPILCDLTTTIETDRACPPDFANNGGFESAGSTSFNMNYQGIPASRLNHSQSFPSWTTVATGTNNSNFMYLNDVDDRVNNPEGDKFFAFQQSGNCLDTDFTLTAGQCYSFSFMAALYGAPGTNAQVELEYWNGDPANSLTTIDEIYIDSESNLRGLTWYKVSGTFTPTASGNFSIFASVGNVNGPFDGALFIDDFKASECCNTICFGESIRLSAIANSSNNPLSYNWSSGQTSPNIDVSPTVSTEYFVTITDGQGCVSVEQIDITVNPDLSCFVTEEEKANCDNAFAGSATVTPVGGTNLYTYLWDNGETTATATSLNIGPHSVTVTDANNCTTVCNFDMLKEPPQCTNIYTNGFSRTNLKFNR